MTYRDDSDSPELRLKMDDQIDDRGGDPKGDFLELSGSDAKGSGLIGVSEGSSLYLWRWRGSVVWYWIKLASLFAFLGLLAAVVLKWVAPYFMDKEVMPIIKWGTTTFSTPVLAILVFGSVALFPTLLLPSTPSMWVAGMKFGYGFGFLLIISAVAVGVSLPYFIGSLFLHKIRVWLDKYPKRAAVLRAAGEGNWFHQFRAVILIRISPFPYIVYNYCAVATHVKYGPYILGSLVGIVPEVFVAIYTGIVIQALADASSDERTLSAPQIIFNVVGFCSTVATTIFFTLYAKRQLNILQDDPLLE